jgi:hypothetical protein
MTSMGSNSFILQLALSYTQKRTCTNSWEGNKRCVMKDYLHALQRTTRDVACCSGGPHLGQALDFLRQKGSTGAYGLVVRITIFLFCSTSYILFRSYKKNKFNLLWEQSEGFSKLVTEVTSALPPPHSPATALPLEPSSIAPERVQPIWERIVSLIGYFDLESKSKGIDGLTFKPLPYVDQNECISMSTSDCMRVVAERSILKVVIYSGVWHTGSSIML